MKKTLFFHFSNVFLKKIAIFAFKLRRNRHGCKESLIYMETKDLNRLKVVLAEKKRTNKWLAEQLGKDPATISKWCTNNAQPNLENLVEIAKVLEVDINDLIRK